MQKQFKPINKAANTGLFTQLKVIRQSNQGTVTFHFEDGTKQVQNINSSIFYDEKGRQQDLDKVVQTFKDISHDLGAKYFTI